MAGELKHKSQGAALTQAEYENVDAHLFDSQATGDLPYASSATQLSRLAKGTARYQLGMSATIPAWYTPAFDGIVDVGGDGHWTTLQAGDDDLDAGNYSMWVKQGTYTAGLTVSTDKAYIFVEPGTVIQGAITLSGDNITLVLGAGCDVQELITLSGANCSLLCQNGVDIDGILVSGNFGLVDGGGWETISNGGTARIGISITGTDGIAKNIACQTTAGGGQSYDALRMTGDRDVASRVKVIDSDNNGIDVVTGGAMLIEGCMVLGADVLGIDINAPRTRCIGNYVIASGNDGIRCDDSGDNSLVVGNTVQNQANQPIDVSTNCEDCVVVGNRTDGAVADNSGTSTVASNEETAF